MAHKIHKTPSGLQFCTVDREILRTESTHTARLPRHLKRAMAKIQAGSAAWSWSKGGTIALPILGNSTKGDCWLAAALHFIQTATANVLGVEASFTEADALARYDVLSPGDQGLSDVQLFGAWAAGLVRVGGPYCYLDKATIDPTDPATMDLMGERFGGLLYTASLLDQWVANPQPGQIWDAVGRADPSNGHAMLLSGKNAGGYYDVETWGLKPCIELTLRGMQASDPEITVVVSRDWYNAQGYSPANHHYTEDMTLWHATTGQTLPPSIYPPPIAPTPGPTPTPTPTPAPTPTPDPTPAPVHSGPSLIQVCNRAWDVLQSDSGSPLFMRKRLEAELTAGFAALFKQFN